MVLLCRYRQTGIVLCQNHQQCGNSTPKYTHDTRATYTHTHSSHAQMHNTHAHALTYTWSHTHTHTRLRARTERERERERERDHLAFVYFLVRKYSRKCECPLKFPEHGKAYFFSVYCLHIVFSNSARVSVRKTLSTCPKVKELKLRAQQFHEPTRSSGGPKL